MYHWWAMSKNSIYVLKECTRLLVIPCDIVVVLHRFVDFLQVFLILILYCLQSLLYPSSVIFSEICSNTCFVLDFPSSSACIFMSPHININVLVSFSPQAAPRLELAIYCLNRT
jgi:hypothetical protein